MKHSDRKLTTRRGLLKGAAIGAGAVAAGSLPVAAAAQEDARVEEADVLVVGMGFAGLVAGLRAAQLGADVVIIDKQPSGDWIGGSMMLSGQMIHTAMSSPMIPDEDLREVVRTRMVGRTEKPYAEVMEAYLTNVKRGMQWLMDLGVEFEEEPGLEMRLKPAKPTSPYGYAWAKLKPGGELDYRNYGGYKTAKLLETALADSGARMLYETKAEQLLTDETGAVVGVRAVDADGAFEIRAKSVILATGGFARNKEMSAKYLGPHGEEIPVQSCPGNTGDGIRMGLEVGADMRNMSYTYWWPAPAAAEGDSWADTMGMRTIDSVAIESLIVTDQGDRVCDESKGRFTYGAELFRRGYTKGVMIFDQSIYDMEAVKPIVDAVIELGGTVFQADTIEDLAVQAGVNPYLATTVAEFNAAVDDGTVTNIRFPKSAKANKVETAPFYALPFVNGTLFHYGGLQINSKGEVLTAEDKPIAGLYGIGELIGGSMSGGTVNFAGAYAGALAGACLTYGLIAAENAVERAGAA